MPLWIDTHCHLDAPEFDADRDAVLARAHSRGVSCLVLPAVTADHFEPLRRLAERTGQPYALGLHPLWTGAAEPEASLARLDAMLAATRDDPRRVAVGEIGIDGFEPGLDAARQRHFLAEQLKLARRHDLPVILHVRRSADAVLALLRRHPVRGGIAHAFNGSPEQARRFVDSGFKLGFGGVFTFSRANRVRRLAQDMPIESIVLETDAPDLAPAWLADDQFGEQGAARNAPAEVARIAEAMAQLRGISIDALADQARRNSIEAIPRLAALLHA